MPTIPESEPSKKQATAHTSTGVTSITCVKGVAITNITVDDTVSPCNTNSGNCVF